MKPLAALTLALLSAAAVSPALAEDNNVDLKAIKAEMDANTDASTYKHPVIRIEKKGDPVVPPGTVYNNNGTTYLGTNVKPEDGSYRQRDKVIGPDGKEYTVTRDVDYNEDGAIIRTTTEGPDGKKHTTKSKISTD